MRNHLTGFYPLNISSYVRRTKKNRWCHSQRNHFVTNTVLTYNAMSFISWLIARADILSQHGMIVLFNVTKYIPFTYSGKPFKAAATGMKLNNLMNVSFFISTNININGGYKYIKVIYSQLITFVTLYHQVYLIRQTTNPRTVQMQAGPSVSSWTKVKWKHELCNCYL